jgi:hypothetical protein
LNQLYISTITSIIICCIICSSSLGQPPYFVKYFGAQEINEQARAILQLNNGSVFLGGYSNISGNTDPALLKLNKQGDSLWMKTYGDTVFDVALSLNYSGNADLVLCGERLNELTGTDLIVMKIDSVGTLLWESVIATNKNESGKYIEQTQDGGFLICGYQSDDFGFNDILLAKLDAYGTLEWINDYGGVDNEYANQVHELPDGTIILTADTRSKGAGGYDVEILRLTPAGEIIWDYTYGDDLENGCQGIYIAANGDLISYGETETFPFSPFDFYIERISPEGSSIWRKVFGGAGSDAAFSLVEDDAGNFILTGYSNSYNGGEAIDVVIAKTNPFGELIWANSYGNSGIDIGYGIAQTDEGFLIGATAFNDGSNDFCVLYVSEEGLLTSIIETTNSFNQPVRLSVNPNPSNGYFELVFDEAVNDLHVEIFDLTGRCVFESIANGLNKKVPIRFQGRQGMYLLLIKSNAGIYRLPVELY